LDYTYEPQLLDYSEDKLWVCRRPAEEIIDIVGNPLCWIDTLGHCERKLISPVTITIQRPDGRIFKDFNGDILVQGIDGTNALAIMPTVGSTVSLNKAFRRLAQSKLDRLGLAPFSLPSANATQREIIESLVTYYSSGDLQITICEDDFRLFVHFEIFDKSMLPGVDDELLKLFKHYIVGLFHCCACQDPKFLRRIMASRTQSSLAEYKFSSGQLQRKPPSPQQARKLKLDHVSLEKVPFIISADSSTTQTTCENLLALWQQGVISYAQAHCKLYSTP
jgi:hypothetical protein